MRVIEPKDRVWTWSVVFLAAFVVSVAFVSRTWFARERGRSANVVATAPAAKPAPRPLTRDQELWSRADKLVGSLQATVPPQVPLMEDSRLIWKVRDGQGRTGTSLGFQTEKDSASVAIHYLEHFRDAGGWDLVSSTMLGAHPNDGWAGVMYSPKELTVVALFALPKKMMTDPGPDNPTRVSAIVLRGEELARAWTEICGTRAP